jgi:hypothetical protein
MTAAPDLALALDALRAVASRVHTATDDELLADGAVIEELGRLVDSHRLDFAAEVERRTVSPDGGLPLARREGARDAVDLVAHLARIGRPAAKQRIGLGAALAPEVSLRGDLLPGRFGVLADAVRAGEVGVESARVVVTKLLHLRPRITAEEFADAVVVLTDTAKTEETEVVRDVAEGLALLLDPDGAEPTERNQRFQRAFALGRTRADGMTAARLLLTPEHLAVVKELLESQRRGVPLLRTVAGGGQDGDAPDPEWRESLPAEGDEPRSRAQQDYDTVLGAIESGIRAEQSAAVTHEVVVHVSADDLEARRGQGWTSGVLAGIPIPVIERRACSGGVRLLVTGAHGEPLHLSRSKRVFTAAQSGAEEGAHRPRGRPVRVPGLHHPGAVPGGAPRRVVPARRRPDGRRQRRDALQPSPPPDPRALGPRRDPALAGRALVRAEAVGGRSAPGAPPASRPVRRSPPGATTTGA